MTWLETIYRIIIAFGPKTRPAYAITVVIIFAATMLATFAILGTTGTASVAAAITGREYMKKRSGK